MSAQTKKAPASGGLEGGAPRPSFSSLEDGSVLRRHVRLTAAELEVIWAAAAALPPPQRPAFQELVAAELKSLPCGMIGPGTLHRVIAAAQKTILNSGMLAVGPSPKHAKSDGITARAKWAREA